MPRQARHKCLDWLALSYVEGLGTSKAYCVARDKTNEGAFYWIFKSKTSR